MWVSDALMTESGPVKLVEQLLVLMDRIAGGWTMKRLSFVRQGVGLAR
jgi:hypothetical protein